MIQGTDGNLYGTTSEGGANDLGTIFRIDTNGTTFTTLHSFAVSDGSQPGHAGLIQGTDGNLYGTTERGGASGRGTVFKMDTNGTALTTLHSFGGGDGAYPFAGLVQGTDGNLYGTTWQGGENDLGTSFKIDTNGITFTTLHRFAGTDGAGPSASLIQATDGHLYGTTWQGGENDLGTIFKMDLSGNVTTLHRFAGSDGSNPFTALIQATDGNLYGTTATGGEGAGVVFRLSPPTAAVSGTTSILQRVFDDDPGGADRHGALESHVVRRFHADRHRLESRDQNRRPLRNDDLFGFFSLGCLLRRNLLRQRDDYCESAAGSLRGHNRTGIGVCGLGRQRCLGAQCRRGGDILLDDNQRDDHTVRRYAKDKVHRRTRRTRWPDRDRNHGELQFHGFCQPGS